MCASANPLQVFRMVCVGVLVFFVSAATAAEASSSYDDSSISTLTTSARYTDYSSTSSEHETSSLPEPSSAECASIQASCQADIGCSTCLPQSDEDFDSESSCQERYPIIKEKSATVCELAGAAYCCFYDNVSTAKSCLSSDPVVDFWECVLSLLGFDCTVEDMPCYGDVATLSPETVPETDGSSSEGSEENTGRAARMTTTTSSSFLATLAMSSVLVLSRY